MNADSITPKISSTYAELKGRCDELGLRCWCFSGDGTFLSQPAELGVTAEFFDSPVLRQEVAAAVTRQANLSGVVVVDLFPEFRLLMVQCDPGNVGAVLLPGREFTGTRAFVAICQTASIDGTQMAEAISSVFHTQAQLKMLEKVLEWTCCDLLQADRQQQAIEQFSDTLVQAYEQVNLLYRLARHMNYAKRSVQSLETICEEALQVLPFQWIATALTSRGKMAASDIGHTVIVGNLPCSKEAIESEVEGMIAKQSVEDCPAILRPDTDALAALVRSEVLFEPIKHDGDITGALIAGNKGSPDPEVHSAEIQMIEALARFLGVFQENMARFVEQRAMFLGTLKALTSSIDAKDHYTHGHSERVALLSRKLATKLGLSEQEVERVWIAGVVHDVGKIGVPESVLMKPGKLTYEEFEQIKQHPLIGYEILKDIPPLAKMLPGVRSHHERWDGGGYPDGLAGENIPVIARILAVADAFDAMSSTRSYRPALTREKALKEISDCGGTQFDPALAKIFVNLDLTDYYNMVQHHHAITSDEERTSRYTGSAKREWETIVAD